VGALLAANPFGACGGSILPIGWSTIYDETVLTTCGRFIITTASMPRTKKRPAGRPRKGKSHGFLEDHNHEDSDEQGLPSDEAGRLKIKKNYEELLGIRIEKLRGRVLNREKINKSIDGIYFICAECKKVCHNLDEGLVEDPQNQLNLCGACAKGKGIRGTAA